jgi:hypothetical protein
MPQRIGSTILRSRALLTVTLLVALGAVEKASGQHLQAGPSPSVSATPAPVVVGIIKGRPGSRSDCSDRWSRYRSIAPPPTFVGELEFEPESQEVAVDRQYTLKVFVKNVGPEAMAITELRATTRLDRKPGPDVPATLTTTNVSVGERTEVGTVTGKWEGVEKWWILKVTVTGAKTDDCSNLVDFRRY